MWACLNRKVSIKRSNRAPRKKNRLRKEGKTEKVRGRASEEHREDEKVRDLTQTLCRLQMCSKERLRESHMVEEGVQRGK